MKRSRLVFLLCIIAAFFLWVVYTLSNEYTSYFRFPLEVATNLEGRTDLSQADNTLFVRGTARGFYIIRHAWRKKVPSIKIFADKTLMREYPDRKDQFYLLADNIHNLVNDALGNDLQLETILTDTIHLEYGQVHYRKVPVRFISDISYKPQYMSFQPVRIYPDSVLVYAGEPYLEMIEEVKTRKVSLGNLDQTVEGITRLEIPVNTRLSQTEVTYEVMVKRYVELSFEVAVTTRNVPYRRELIILPDVVTLQFRCPFEEAANINARSLALVVDYNEFTKKDCGKIIPSLEGAPAMISHVLLTPQFVDGIIQNRY
ncbi:MAG: hypothetical protein WCQ69_06535 [Bacteroidales bacterium]|jgi:hypothetical protein|nr:hypothetical protein [Bacteroidales bacterium]MDD2264555.1 hypothetical protein [Bacteroidales bacterium]MDD2831790.1 hypothetical protein [Bacteroidales bacterium]MDD3209315.1 hypothetical protein [Bacteroidales bacterium]MDD3697760.1 hypothetical protein [Bacteroidales bacterium]